MKLSANKPCPCGSGKKTKGCCAPVLTGVPARSPEALMRSRYTAYVSGNINHIMNTTHPAGDHYQQDQQAWQKEIDVFCTQFSFHGLEVRETKVQGNQGWVTFHARISQGERDVSFTEKSFFLLENGRWLYHSGTQPTEN